MTASAAEVVLPSREDPVVAAGAGLVGGPAGRRVRGTRAVAVLLLLTALSGVLALMDKQPCRANAWTSDSMYPQMCYSDIAFLYRGRAGLPDAGNPYAAVDGGAQALEYPVLTGGFMWVAAWVTKAVDGGAGLVDRSRTFFDVNVVLLTACALATTWLIARTAGRRPWDAALFALAPGLVLTAFINWDLLAVALTAGFLLAWARSRPVLAGVLLGLAVAAKFYPVVLLGPLLVLALRAGRMPVFWRTAGSAVLAWLVVNLPVAVLWPSGWGAFYSLSQERGAGFGSLWYVFERAGHPLPSWALNPVASGSLLLLCLGIGWLALAAPRRPRLGQLAFLVVVAFAVTNKVYSPQYVLWMLALYPLARPRWRELIVWATAEALYFVAVWWHLQALTHPTTAFVPEWTHSGATLLRILVTLWVAGLVVRDIWSPEHDPIRADGSDDPAGGPFDRAPDQVTLTRFRDRAVPGPALSA
jgi:uncharacterized membrane protein